MRTIKDQASEANSCRTALKWLLGTFLSLSTVLSPFLSYSLSLFLSPSHSIPLQLISLCLLRWQTFILALVGAGEQTDKK